jgi:twitching motility protein PilT
LSWNLDKIMKGVRKFGASDVHLVQGLTPAVRIDGAIHMLDGQSLDGSELRAIVEELLTDQQKAIFASEWQVCFSRLWPGVGRFRASVYTHAGCPELAIRICESAVRSQEDLGLTPLINDLTRLTTGLVLVTGPTGVGKTTTLNYMVNLINQERRAKIVTIEDPVEYVHENLRSIIIQQEVGTDVQSFRKALVHVLRQDPDVIVVGEMRDLETIETTLTAAETGHLVLATLHTPDAVQTVQRIYSVFPADQQNHIIMQLAHCLQAIIAQKLLPRASSKGRVLAWETCVATSAVRNHIREKSTHQIYSEMQTGRKYGMKTMDASLIELYQKGEITYDVAISNARDPAQFRQPTN